MNSWCAVWPRRIVGLRVVLLLVALAVGAGFALAFGMSGVGAKNYSAYADPQKPVLAFLLADDRNREEFKKQFGLSDEKMQEILAVVREENGALSREYEETNQIVEANEGASEKEIRNKIAASDFDEKVKRAVAGTKSDVKKLLPKREAGDLRSWVDDQFQAETVTYTAASEDTYQASSVGYSCKVWATYYSDKSDYWVALPHWKVRFSGGRKVRVTDIQTGTSARAPVKDTGPWNTRDNYWRIKKYRSMWNDLPRCVPEAAAAYYDNYNRGKDQFGREVLNPAAIDITPAVARRMDVWRKIQRRGLIRVRVRYLWR